MKRIVRPCRHNRCWLVAGGHIAWCYECGAIRKCAPIKGETNAVASVGCWVKPTGRGGRNPWTARFDGPNAPPVRSEPLLDSMQFRNIITFLKHGGMKVSARWLVMKVGGLSVKKAGEYVDDCHVYSDGIELRESNAGGEGRQPARKGL